MKLGSAESGGHVIHWARRYDLLDRLLPFLRRIRLEFVDLVAPAAGEQVLDVGCGTGTLALAIKSRVGAGQVHGIDPSPEMVQVAQDKAAKSAADLEFHVAGIEALPFSDGSFDLVTSTLMLHHLSDDLKRRGLAEVRRVLKRSGRFVAMDFASHSHSLFGHLLAAVGHAHGGASADELAPLLKEAGFREVELLPWRRKSFVAIRAR